jgi:hypothetical protein
MSFLDDVGSFASDVFTSNLGGSLARTALTVLAAKQLLGSAWKKQDPDPGVRVQSEADTQSKIPVVYGKAFLGGKVVDVVLTGDYLTMYFCFALSEKTGPLSLGAGAASEFSFNSVFWNDCRLYFGSDGVTVTHSEDRDGNIDTDINGLLQVFCFAGNSDTPVALSGYATPTTPAYSIFPNWTSNHDMSNLIFAIAKITYNKEKNVTSVGNFRFEIENTMKAAGDCMYDYMTNTRYGAGLLASEIYVS